MTTAFLLLAALLETPQDPNAGILSGRAISSSGMPLKRVRVQIAARKGSAPRPILTGRDGSFLFNVNPGTYTITCSKKGYLTSGYGSKGPDQPPADIYVPQHGESAGKDCRLQHNGSINGNISDEDGDPLADVDVSALLRRYRHGQPEYRRVASVRSDDHGHYRLYELPPGRYCLQAWRAPREADPALAPMFYPNSLHLNDCLTLDLRHGDEATRIDLILRETPTFTLRGKIRESRLGRPPAGASLLLIPEDYGGEVRTSVVGNDGAFEFPNLIPARYRYDILMPDDRGRPRHWTKVVELESSDKEETVTAGVWPRVIVTLNVATPSLATRNVLPQGFRVTLVPRDSAFDAVPITGVARPGDVFDLETVLPGNYDLRVEQTGRVAFFVSDISIDGRSIDGRSIDGRSIDGRTAGESEISISDSTRLLTIAATIDLQPAAISGRVLDEEGKPYSGAGVIAWSTDSQKRLQETYFKTAFTDSSGNYRLSSLIPGDYFVAVWTDYDPHQALEPEILRRLEGSAIRVEARRQDNSAGEFRVTSEVRSIPDSYVR